MDNNSFLQMIESSNKDLLTVEYDLSLALGKYYTEALEFGKRQMNDKDSLWTTIKKFFTKLISGFQEFMRKISIEIKYRVDRITTSITTRMSHKKANELREAGVKVVEIHDVFKVVGIYNKAINELNPILSKLSKNNYDNLDDMDTDLNRFNVILNTANSSIDKAKDDKIKVGITDYIHFLEREISGNSNIFKSLNMCEREVQLMYSEVMKMQTKRNILGPDIIAKKVNIFKKISSDLVQFIKTCLSKIIIFINVF